MGIAALDAFGSSELLQEPDGMFVDAVLDSLLEEPVEQIEEGVGEVDVTEIHSNDRT